MPDIIKHHYTIFMEAYRQRQSEVRAAKTALNMNKSDHYLILPQQHGEALQINLFQFKKAAVILRAINHPIRQQIIRLLQGQKSITVTNLVDELKMLQSVVSQHLAILRRAGIIKFNREGKFIFYSLDMERLNQLNKHVTGITG